MSIPTQMSVHGFIATAPELTFTSAGHARLHCGLGIEQHHRETDGTFTKLDPVYCDLVMFDRAAEQAYPRFTPGDQILAVGYIHEYEHQRIGAPSQIREQFVARRIGHDSARTRYTVDRTPTTQPDPPTSDRGVVQEPTPSVTL